MLSKSSWSRYFLLYKTALPGNRKQRNKSRLDFLTHHGVWMQLHKGDLLKHSLQAREHQEDEPHVCKQIHVIPPVGNLYGNFSHDLLRHLLHRAAAVRVHVEVRRDGDFELKLLLHFLKGGHSGLDESWQSMKWCARLQAVRSRQNARQSFSKNKNEKQCLDIFLGCWG